MATANVSSPAGDVTGIIELPASLFDAEVSIPLVHQVVVAQLAAARQGTHDTKTRGEVRGGGRKPYRQKGTGRARQGSTRAPQFVGGGTVHGPTPRSYAQRTPKKMKAAALRAALSDRARGGRVHVVSGLVEGETPSTKSAASVLAAVAESRHVLAVIDRSDTLGWKSARNLSNVHVIAPDQLNTYDVLVSDDVVFTEAALETFVSERAAEGETVVVTPVKKTAAKKTAAKKTTAKTTTAKTTTAKKATAKEAAATTAAAADEPVADEATVAEPASDEPAVADASVEEPVAEASDEVTE